MTDAAPIRKRVVVPPLAPSSTAVPPPAPSSTAVPPPAPRSAPVPNPTPVPAISTPVPPAVPSMPARPQVGQQKQTSSLQATIKKVKVRDDQEEHRKKSFKAQPSSKDLRVTVAGAKQQAKKDEKLKEARKNKHMAAIVAGADDEDEDEMEDEDEDSDSDTDSAIASMQKTIKEGQDLLAGKVDEFGSMED